jgi:20S proteasome subunit alpha 5
MGRSEYDRGTNTFSPEGRIFQIEYAIEAIKLGSTAVGVCVKEGTVLAVEKRVTSPLVESSSIEKILEIDKHVGCAMSGLIADARTLVDNARVEAQHHWFTYNEKMPVESCVKSISDHMLDFSTNSDKKKSMSRPFGVALLVAGFNGEGAPALFSTDPSGTYSRYKACAIGSASEGAMSMLQEQYKEDMTFADAKQMALVVLRQVMEEKISSTNIELATCGLDMKFHMYSPEELQQEIDGLPAPTVPTLAQAAGGQAPR